MRDNNSFFHSARSKGAREMKSTSWREIQAKWLKGISLDYSPDEIMTAFDSIERYLGEKYLDGIKTRGSVIVLPLIELGLILRDVGPLENSDTILKGLRSHNQSALAEARVIAHYRKHRLPVIIEPEIEFEHKVKRPDLAVKFGSDWIYIEVSSPTTSKEVREINLVMSKIGRVVEEIIRPRKVFIYLKRTPTKNEIQTIKEICLSLSADATQPAIREITGVGVVTSREIEQEERAKTIKIGEHVRQFAPVIYNKEDLTIPTQFKILRVPYLFHLNIGFVGFPRVYIFHFFTDERVEKLISRESDQLSPYNRNMIALDVTKVSSVIHTSSSANWVTLIQRRLQPQLNRRVGGVLLIATNIDNNRIVTSKQLVEHPNPYKRLPKGFLEITLNS